ncbi:uncharacterized protein LOC110028506 [Phalaenopsis equestris]|uniref:uncharacterized protein LOC110028506 n=1 Tax=Phalaenopsis equestris TaxID=78828 RepID=UPI0009E30566|nr:uncharacterized protein LOC110028506 [Phalaenopsis equestris]
MESTGRLELVAIHSNAANDDERLNGGDDAVSSPSGEEKVVDVSGNSWDLSPFERLPPPSSTQGLYFYHNTFHLIPNSIGGLKRLRTLKFFANEIEILPPEIGDLKQLESLQVKVTLPGLSGISLQKLKSLRDLELCRVPPKLTDFSILGDISGLKCLTKLSICHFSIRYLPPEIGHLKMLEELDLSFNKLKNLPDDLAGLVSLKSLRVANNKLIDLPPGISSLRSLERLDLSNNRLTSLASLKLNSMDALQYLNLQYNKLPYHCQIPSWINYNLEGNGDDIPKGEACGSCSNDYHSKSSALCTELHSSCRCLVSQKRKKGWKRRDDLQQRARQERLNYSRKCRVSDHTDDMSVIMGEESNCCRSYVVENSNSEIQVDDDDIKLVDSSAKSKSSSNKNTGDAESVRCDLIREHSLLPQFGCSENEKDTRLNRSDISEGDVCSCSTNSAMSSKVYDCEYESVDELNVIDRYSFAETSNLTTKSKRHSDKDLDNPKPAKFRKPVVDCSYLASKYCVESFCSFEDHLPDGFYDAGRDRPFKSLQEYEQCVCIDSREVILLDREKDEELDAITLSARLLLSNFRRCNLAPAEDGVFDDFPIVSILALFVSDCFGGSDRSTSVLRLRKSLLGSNKLQPFICTCSAGNLCDNSKVSKKAEGTVGGFDFNELCENSLRMIKKTRNSSVVPLGAMQFGVCRHRAVLMKYLCDRSEPPVPCELVRGYLDFMPHAWNVVRIRSGNSWRRMIVDACYPADIRDENDPEFYSRYIPLSRLHASLTYENSSILGVSFPSPSMGNGVAKVQPRSVFHGKFGTMDAAVKVRSLEVEEASQEDIKKLEYAFLGELRMLGALRKHSCIVEIYGHQISSKWVPVADGHTESRILQFIIVMEYVKGGSIKGYLDKLLESGDKHVPLDIALFIARDVACALVELHSKFIIHRDIKSENILIDLDCKRRDGSPIVKLSDFDRSVPLHSSMHTCCIAHIGVHPPDVCVGTPRWMAPEVLQAMHQRNSYGLEVDIWSYGCVLFELLTLQIPYAGKSETEIYDLLRMKQRPPLPPKLEALMKSEEVTPEFDLGLSNADMKKMRVLLDLFHQCTEGDPADRPTAIDVYDKLCSASQQSPDSTQTSSPGNG